MFPLGYAILVFLYGFVLPILVGLINFVIVSRLYDAKLHKIYSFWTYGLLLTLIVLSFKTISDYTNWYVMFVTIPSCFACVSLAGKFVREED